MVRVVGAVVVVQMAGTTRRRSTCISVRMAFDASRCCMRTMQWECGVVMIEGCRTPIRFVVALRTVSWEARGRVVRSGRAVVVIHMARIARSWCACISISVAFNTSCSDVRSVQWESRVIMIETRRAPIRSRRGSSRSDAWCPCIQGIHCIERFRRVQSCGPASGDIR